MKTKLILAYAAFAAVGTISQQSMAQVAGAQTIGTSATQVQIIVNGWSVNKSLLGKPIFNDHGERVGVLHDIIVAPDDAISYAIIAAHQFIGVSEHDVAVPINQLDYAGGKLVWAGATRDAVKAIPKFEYAKVRAVPMARADYEHH
uniref:PRC-barrel domain-containing protein n=1 Tax=Caballeronia sp. LjRoot34 TaxID=3342325 RepID=UPI003F4F7413